MVKQAPAGVLTHLSNLIPITKKVNGFSKYGY